MNKKSIQGFTLIEMLIVIAVISILAGIVLVGITGFQSGARDTKRIGDLRGMQNTLELFYTRCGHYPMDGAGGCGIATGGSGSGTVTWGQAAAGGLAKTLLDVGIISDLKDLPMDPKAGVSNQYAYAYGDGGYSYVIRASLENQNAAMNDDTSEVDGTSFGNLNCEDATPGFFYCIRTSE